MRNSGHAREITTKLSSWHNVSGYGSKTRGGKRGLKSFGSGVRLHWWSMTERRNGTTMDLSPGSQDRPREVADLAEAG